MRVFICTDHDGHCPVGVASVVVAANRDDAYLMLLGCLEQHGLGGKKDFTLREIDTTKPAPFILCSGNY